MQQPSIICTLVKTIICVCTLVTSFFKCCNIYRGMKDHSRAHTHRFKHSQPLPLFYNSTDDGSDVAMFEVEPRRERQEYLT